MPMGSYGPVPGIELTWFLALRLLDLGCDNASLDRGGNALGDLVLEGKDIGQFAIVAIRPQVVTSRRLDQLCGDAETIGGPPHAAFEHVAHAELATDFAYVHSRTLVSKGGAARDHKKCMVVRQVGDDVLGDTLREILLFGLAAHIGKGQHRDRRLLLWWSCRSGRGDRCRDYLIGRRIEPNAMDRHRPGDVLDLVFAHVLEGKMQLVAHLIAHDAADADAPGLRQG